jgi:hypothetical protein
LFFCAVFGSVYHRYRYDVALTSTEEARAQYHLQKIYRSSLYKSAMSVKEFLGRAFTRYMVWIFHFCVFLGVALEAADVFSLLLFVVESLVFTAHLAIEWTAPWSERNAKMRRWAMASVVVIGVLIFFRYSAYFTRYYIGQSAVHWFMSVFGLVSSDTKITDLFTQTSRFYRLFSKANSSSRMYMVFAEFYVQLFYLCLASLALLSLKPAASEAQEEDSSEDSIESVGEEVTEIMREPKLTGLSGFDEYIRSIQNTAKKESKKPEELLTNASFMYFFIFLLLQRAFAFVGIVWLCHESRHVLDYCYLLIELLYFTLMFHNLAGEFKAFGLEEFNEKHVELFGNAFCKQLLTFDPVNNLDLAESKDEEEKEKPEDRYARTAVRDIEQNCLLVNSLLGRLRLETVAWTTLVSFVKMSLVALKTCGAIYRLGAHMLMDRTLPADNQSTMVTNTILNAFVLVELLAIKDFRLVPTADSLRGLTADALARLAAMMQAKLDYYRCFVAQSLWEFNRNKQIAKVSSKDDCNRLLRVQTAGEEEQVHDEPEVDELVTTDTRERNKTVMTSLKQMGATSTISQHFNRFRLSSADPNITNQLFLANVQKATKIKIEPKQIMFREKKAKFDEILALYKNFRYSESKFNELFQHDYYQTFGEFSFENPQEFFTKDTDNLEELFHEAEDEFDLGLNTYERHITFAIGIGSPRFLKILLMHKNKAKFSYCTALKGCQYILRRLILIPLLFSVCIEPNLANFPMLLVGIYYAFHRQRTILADIRFFMPIFSINFYALLVWDNLLTLSPGWAASNSLCRPLPDRCRLVLPSHPYLLELCGHRCLVVRPGPGAGDLRGHTAVCTGYRSQSRRPHFRWRGRRPDFFPDELRKVAQLEPGLLREPRQFNLRARAGLLLGRSLSALRSHQQHLQPGHPPVRRHLHQRPALPCPQEVLHERVEQLSDYHDSEFGELVDVFLDVSLHTDFFADTVHERRGEKGAPER